MQSVCVEKTSGVELFSPRLPFPCLPLTSCLSPSYNSTSCKKEKMILSPCLSPHAAIFSSRLPFPPILSPPSRSMPGNHRPVCTRLDRPLIPALPFTTSTKFYPILSPANLKVVLQQVFLNSLAKPKSFQIVQTDLL